MRRVTGAGDQQHVGVAGRSNDVQPKTLEVVEGVGGAVELVFASIAGAGVDVANRQGARNRSPQTNSASHSIQVAKEHEHSAIYTGIAELEALVDEGKLRE